jgi:adenosylmethionine-8-amino-7-oxononanoate aminotransferase
MTDTVLWSSNLSPRLYERLFAPNQCLIEGRGAKVCDAGGRWYVDARSALWNATLGYSHPTIISAIQNQVATLPVASAVRHFRPADISVRYANALINCLPQNLTRLRFGNTGSQMVETAVMLSRAVRIINDEIFKKKVLVFDSGYHGAGGLASSLSDSSASEKLGPLSNGIVRIAIPEDGQVNCVVKETFEKIGSENITAILIEPVIGESIRVIDSSDLHKILELAKSENVHLIVDEVTTGCGRTIGWSSAGAKGIEPDMLVLGKGLTAGYIPGAALAIAEHLYETVWRATDIQPFPIGSTTDGHPLAMAAGLAVIDVLEGDILSSSALKSDILRSGLEGLKKRHSSIASISGEGMMLGVHMSDDGKSWSGLRLEQLRIQIERHGVLVHPTKNCITILPPLVVGIDDVEQILFAVDTALTDVG